MDRRPRDEPTNRGDVASASVAATAAHVARADCLRVAVSPDGLGLSAAATNPRFRNESLPLIVASLSAAFIILAIVWRLAGRLAATEEREAAWREQLSEGAGQQGAQPEEPTPWFAFLLAVVYLGSFFGLVFGFGMYIGVPAFLLGFLVLHGKLPWQATALIFVVVGLGLPLIFRLAFNLRLWVGAIPELVGGG